MGRHSADSAPRSPAIPDHSDAPRAEVSETDGGDAPDHGRTRRIEQSAQSANMWLRDPSALSPSRSPFEDSSHLA